MKPYTDRPLSLQQRSVFGLSALCGAGVGILLAVGWHLAVRAVLPSGALSLPYAQQDVLRN